jgi:hypothetical protein
VVVAIEAREIDSLADVLDSANVCSYTCHVEPPEREHGTEKERVGYYLLNCELFDEERDAPRKSVGAQG